MSIQNERDGWDFFRSDDLAEHIEADNDTPLYADDIDAELAVLYRTLADLEQYITASQEIDELARDVDGYRVNPVFFARRVLAAVGRPNPELAKEGAEKEDNAFLTRLLRDPDWIAKESIELLAAAVGDGEPEDLPVDEDLLPRLKAFFPVLLASNANATLEDARAQAPSMPHYNEVVGLEILRLIDKYGGDLAIESFIG